MIYNKLLIPLCLLFFGCGNNEIIISVEEYNQLKTSKKRITIFDKKREHSEEELNWRRENEIFQVFVDKNNQIFVKEKLTNLTDLKGLGKSFFYNYHKVSDSPFATELMISLRSPKGVNYQFYLLVYSELRQIYSELWEEEAQKIYKTSFKKLKIAEKKEVRKKIPLNLSESEPTEF